MNPRVKAIEDTKKGKYNPDSWNMIQPYSDDDKRRHFVAKTYLLFIIVIFTFFTFYMY